MTALQVGKKMCGRRDCGVRVCATGEWLGTGGAELSALRRRWSSREVRGAARQTGRSV